MSKEWLIKLDDVTISYKIEKHLARKLRTPRIFTPLTGISMEVLDGELLSISGPNGSGKTSLLKILSGLMRPFEGAVSWKKQNFGFVSQNQVLLPELSLKENILLPYYLRDVDPDDNGGTAAQEENVEALERRMNDYVRRFAIEDILEKKPRTCSVGQQQRSLLARALIMDRDVIFADEPEQNLDSDGRIELFQSFKEANNAYGKTIVLVSQEHPDVLKEFVTRSIRIKGQSIIESFVKGA